MQRRPNRPKAKPPKEPDVERADPGVQAKAYAQVCYSFHLGWLDEPLMESKPGLATYLKQAFDAVWHGFQEDPLNHVSVATLLLTAEFRVSHHKIESNEVETKIQAIIRRLVFAGEGCTLHSEKGFKGRFVLNGCLLLEEGARQTGNRKLPNTRVANPEQAKNIGALTGLLPSLPNDENSGTIGSLPKKHESPPGELRPPSAQGKNALAPLISHDMERVRTKLRQAVAKSGLSYSEIGERMGYGRVASRAILSRLLSEGSRRDPSLSTVLKLAKALSISLTDLFKE